MQNTVERKLTVETGTKQVNSEALISGDVEQLVVATRAEGGFEVVAAMGNISETMRKAVAESTAGTSGQTSTTTAWAQARKARIQSQIAQVQTMNTTSLRSGIEKEIQHEIDQLYHQAAAMNRWFMRKFSAYEMNQLMAKIRKLREQMVELIKLSLEKLRELYITLVLKLQVVKA